MQVKLRKYIILKDNIPPFNEALVNWIIKTCQLFITFKSTKFKVIICFAKYARNIIKGDIIANQVYIKVKAFKKDLISLLDYTCVIVAILFNKQTSTNNLLIFIINSKQASLNIKIY